MFYHLFQVFVIPLVYYIEGPYGLLYRQFVNKTFICFLVNFTFLLVVACNVLFFIAERETIKPVEIMVVDGFFALRAMVISIK